MVRIADYLAGAGTAGALGASGAFAAGAAFAAGTAAAPPVPWRCRLFQSSLPLASVVASATGRYQDVALATAGERAHQTGRQLPDPMRALFDSALQGPHSSLS